MHRATLLAALGAAMLAISPAAGAEPPSAPVAPDAKAVPSAQPLSPEDMEAATGGQGVSIEALTQQQLSGVTSGNTVTAGTLTSGQVTFGPGALDGFHGVGNFVINTGANNTLQGAINISIVTAPAG
jgi:hypothetical protein